MPTNLVSVTIGGVNLVPEGDEAGQIYRPRSLRINFTANLRGRCSLQAISREGDGFMPQRGATVDAYYNDVAYFGGVAFAVEREVYVTAENEPNRILHTIEAVDFTLFLERAPIRRFFRNLPAGQIVRALIEEEIPTDIIGTDDVQDGMLVSEADYTDYRSIAECINDLAQRSSSDGDAWIWYIRPDRTLYFGPRLTNIAPFDITDSSDSIIRRRTLRYRESLENYANNVILVGGLRPSEPFTETFNGDLLNRTFTLSGEVFEAPQVMLDGVAQTVAEEGSNTVAQFYWSRSSNQIRQDESQPPVDYLQVLTVVWSSSVQLISGGEDAAEIARQAGIENSSGRWTIVERDDLITTDEAATERISGLLTQFNRTPSQVWYETFETGLQVGQTQLVTRSSYGISDYFTIDDIEYRDEALTILEGEKRSIWVTKVHAVSGAHQEGAVEFFRALADKSTPKPTAGQYTTLVFFLAYQSGTTVSSPIVARDVPGARTVTKAGYLGNARIWCHSDKPTSQSVKVDIRMNGTSIFSGTDYLEYRTTDTNTIYKYTFAIQLVPVGAIFTAHVIQGDTTAANATVELEIRH